MRAIRYLTALGFIAALTAASPAAAVTSVKIIAADGTWLNYTGYTQHVMMGVVFGTGWGCTGASIGPGKFLGGAAGASCAATGSGTGVVYLSGGEWWIDYP